MLCHRTAPLKPKPGLNGPPVRLIGLRFAVAGDRPAVSRCVGDCAKEPSLPMLPSVCFETGRFTLTQSSWTALARCSRKWMSGPAPARAHERDRRLQFTSFCRTPREFLSARKSPLSLDSYLSWMSPGFPGFPPRLARVAARGTWGTGLGQPLMRRCHAPDSLVANSDQLNPLRAAGCVVGNGDDSLACPCRPRAEPDGHVAASARSDCGSALVID